MATLERLVRAFCDGAHCGPGSLARWPGGPRGAERLWLALRRGERHTPDPPGDVLVLSSDDLEHWQVRARISTGFDDRDPKLVADGERLLVYFGTRVERSGEPAVMVTSACETTDGETFGPAREVYGPSWWLWSPIRTPDGFWSTAYGSDVGRAGAPREVVVARSADGWTWTRHATLLGDREGSEGALHRFDDGRLLAVVRGDADETHVFEAPPPYTAWTRATVPHWMHAPALAEVGGRLIVAGRDRLDDDYVTRLWELRDGRTRALLDLPSGGDTSYCGVVPDGDDAILVSYYSQHEFQARPDFVLCEKPAAVYVARVRL